MSVELASNFHFTDKEGDQIYLFGFANGAYIARALAGMLHAVSRNCPTHLVDRHFDGIWLHVQVGLLAKGDKGSMDAAYNLYASNNKEYADMFVSSL